MRAGAFSLAWVCPLLLPLAMAVPAQTPDVPTREARVIDWTTLLPENERRNAEYSGYAAHDYLGEEGPPAEQSGSFAINSELHNTFVRVPGFIVPLTLRQEKEVGEFLLVPYFGACIHMPPPPPNQIIYVKLSQPARIGSIWEPYWITGTLTTAVKGTRTASAAYTLGGIRVEPYR